jgi:hypothetical protein
MYGSELLNYNCSYIAKLCTAWRKVVRRVFRLPYRAHNVIVTGLVENIEVKMHRTVAKFIFSLLHTDNSYVTGILKNAMFSESSILAENYRFLMFKYNIFVSDWNSSLSDVMSKICAPIMANHEQMATIETVRELITMRDDLECTVLSKQDVVKLLNALCID